MKLLIVTDAWYPQVNGAVRTLSEMQSRLTRRGWDVKMVTPGGITMPCPTYPEIRLTLNPFKVIRQALKDDSPDAIHIATEGPLGRAMVTLCRKNKWPYTSSFMTKYPEFLKMRFGLPLSWTYWNLRNLHSTAAHVLVPTKTFKDELESHGFKNVEIWPGGVDTVRFDPSKRVQLPYERPIQLYVGRLAIEKSLDRFLKLETPGTKIVVGDGPEAKKLKQAFPKAIFLGTLLGEELCKIFASADVFVFPSHTDTFGLVNLEALASGTPVAAFRVPGPMDVVCDPRVGVLCDTDLRQAIEDARRLNRDDCRAYALNYSWEKSVDAFEKLLIGRDHRPLRVAPEPALEMAEPLRKRMVFGERIALT